VAVFENNPAAQDFNIQEAISPTKVKEGLFISHIKTTGRTDKFFFLPMDLPHLQEEVAKLIGTQPLIPKWALGWHLGQRGVQNLTEMTKVIDNMKENKFPIDGFWSDVDYMQDM
jgi:alpha-glucosidase (family GH31 glycosyl hydrolase)